MRHNKNLGDNIIMIGLGGSYSYGRDNENSDIDIRGIATNSQRNIFIDKDLEQRFEYDKKNTDLPEQVNIDEANDFVTNINKTVCLG